MRGLTVARAAAFFAWSAAVSLALGAAPGKAEAHALRVAVNPGSSLNVRTGPGTGYGITGHVYAGQLYVEVERRGDWYRLWYDGGTGWSHASYLQESPGTPTGMVTAQLLNVRTGPGTGYRVLGQAPQGARYALVGSDGSWRQIFFGGRSAWVHGAYLDGSGVVASNGGGGNNGGGAPPAGGLPASAAGFIQLPASGTGFFGYYSADGRWGTPRMVYGLMRCGQAWAANQPVGRTRIGIGDISLRNGGPMPGHASHQRGVDADIRPMRNDGSEGPVTRFDGAYSRSRTTALAQLLDQQFDIVYLFFNDRLVPGTTTWPNHDNHLHLRIR